MYDGFICDTCGFTSLEEVGTGNTYYCPKCGNKMRRASRSSMYGGGDANPAGGVFVLDFLYLIFVGGVSFCIMNYITYWTSDLIDGILFILWLILFIVSLVYFHKAISNPDKDNAIKK